ncbi:SDR family NAD(P)-dependent oxidoreductase [Paenibacillus sp. NPDC058071]|uniref:SDR family NAD(P)-dependent oxidoreductase n=1 Tax=Paenibacillus sp. NPDC058071 TaxID=3346326 RepID=UPI0036D86E5B
MTLNRFDGKKVLITGAAGVFGQWIAHAYAEEGATLLLTDVREDALKAAAAKLKEKNQWDESRLSLHASDLSQERQLDELVQFVEKQWGAADIVINGAGIYPYRTLMGMNTVDWEQTMSINLAVPFQLTQRLARQMIERGTAGSFINISSGAASTAAVGMGNYSVSKAGLEMLTKLFALELAEHNIRVNAVLPGYAPGSEVSVMSRQHTEKMIEITPLGRTSGPEDAPQAILFLTSEQAAFITGATLAVDGGRVARS